MKGQLTEGQRGALVGLILEYISLAAKPNSDICETFVVVDEDASSDTFTVWDLLKVVQDLVIKEQPNCGHVPNDPNAKIAICEKCGARIKCGPIGLWIEV